jgi:hypothetical protein
MFDLTGRGLANVHVSGALSVRGFDSGEISHWSAPGVCRWWLGRGGAPGFR